VKTLCAAALLVAACKGNGKDARPHGEAPLMHPPPADAQAQPIDAPLAWPELKDLPPTTPLHVVALPSRPDTPRFDTVGPTLIGEIAVVGTSQMGFVGVDFERGAIAWTKPAGPHVAPPLARGTEAVLVADCLRPQIVAAGQRLLGCARTVVAAVGTDEAYVAIHGAAAEVAAFAAEPGPQHVWPAGDHAVRWVRGERAVIADTLTGQAIATTELAPPPVHVIYKDNAWDVARADTGEIVAVDPATHEPAWRTQRRYTAFVGAVYLPELAPMIRLANVGVYAQHPEINLFDIDATGSLHGQVAFPVPGIGVLASGIGAVGDTALAIELDASLRRDYIVGFAANALIMWVYPLPEIARSDAIGVAVAPDAVVVFHDGDTLTILPELSAPPTAPGAAKAPSQNPAP
jgi:hypothetical protein